MVREHENILDQRCSQIHPLRIWSLEYHLL
jgi:hypothetical protein